MTKLILDKTKKIARAYLNQNHINLIKQLITSAECYINEHMPHEIDAELLYEKYCIPTMAWYDGEIDISTTDFLYKIPDSALLSVDNYDLFYSVRSKSLNIFGFSSAVFDYIFGNPEECDDAIEYLKRQITLLKCFVDDQEEFLLTCDLEN